MEKLFDTEVGVRYCGGEKVLYDEVVAVFEKELKNLIPQLQCLYEEENWKHYTVRVHGLKNSAMTVGALRLAEESKRMEFAGKEERYDDIREGFEAYSKLMTQTLKLIEMYRM